MPKLAGALPQTVRSLAAAKQAGTLNSPATDPQVQTLMVKPGWVRFPSLPMEGAGSGEYTEYPVPWSHPKKLLSALKATGKGQRGCSESLLFEHQAVAV